jgi:hypothetical protein
MNHPRMRSAEIADDFLRGRFLPVSMAGVLAPTRLLD